MTTTVGALLRRDGLLLAPGVYDALSAKLARQAGFEAVFMSGYSVAASLLGEPDIGLLTQTEALEAARRVCAAVECPVIVDADTGYGGVLNVARTVRDLIAAGAKGCFLEDQVWPKRCGHMSGKRVVSREEHAEKIRAACDARGRADFFIVARTDAREASDSLEDAIGRAEAYKRAGADGLFVEAPRSRAELEEISRRLPPPFVANMLEGGVTPILDREELRALGFTIAVFPLTGLFAAARAQRDVFAHLRRTGTTRDVLDQLLTFDDFHHVVDLAGRRALDKRYRLDERGGPRSPDG